MLIMIYFSVKASLFIYSVFQFDFGVFAEFLRIYRTSGQGLRQVQEQHSQNLYLASSL